MPEIKTKCRNGIICSEEEDDNESYAIVDRTNLETIRKLRNIAGVEIIKEKSKVFVFFDNAEMESVLEIMLPIGRKPTSYSYTVDVG